MKTEPRHTVDQLSGCHMVGNVEFAGEGFRNDKRRAEAFAKFMNCTPEQVRSQYCKNSAQLRSMARKASESGKRVNGYTAEQLTALAQKAERCAS